MDAHIIQKSSGKKIGEHIPCRYSMSTILGFDHIKDKHTFAEKIAWKSFTNL